VLPFRVYHDREMSRQALRVLVMLAAHANRNGFLWCGEQKIADDLGVTQEAVSQQILWLKKAGYIEQTAKPYYSGPTARTATLRVVFDPTMSAEDVLARDSRDEGRLLPNIQETNGAITSSNGKVVDRSRVELESTAAALIGEVLERYRGEGLTPPTGHALEREAAMLASMRARQGLSL
jgi:biotin operon repressor